VAARAWFLACLEPNIRRNENAAFPGGYDIAEVNNYPRTAQTLAASDMKKLQAFVAATPQSFKWRKRNTYDEGSVRAFMRNLDAGIAQYFDADSTPPPLLYIPRWAEDLTEGAA
jgi:hypothetical protein